MKSRISRTYKKSAIELRCDELVAELTKKKIIIEPVPHPKLYSHTRPGGEGMRMVSLSRLQNPNKFVAIASRGPSTQDSAVQPKRTPQNG